MNQIETSEVLFPENIIYGVDSVLSAILDSPFYISVNEMALLFGFMTFLSIWIIWAKYFAFQGNFRIGEESGSAKWGTVKEGKLFKDQENEFNNIIFSKHFGMTLSYREDIELDRNWNNLVIGGSGSGKTFCWVQPNLMQLHSDYFVTDPKGSLLPKIGNFMAENGYKIRSFNTINFSESLHFNPLKYVKSDDEILSFVKCLIVNTTPKGASKGDSFWESAETLLYVALISFLRDWMPPNDYTLSGLLTLLDMAEAKEENENFKSPLDLLFKQIEEGGKWVKKDDGARDEGIEAFTRKVKSSDASHLKWVPSVYKHNTTGIRPADNGGLTVEEDLSLSNYNAFKVAAGKTLKSIIISCNVRLKPFAIREVRELLTYDEMELNRLGDDGQRSLIMAIISDTNPTFRPLFAIMMWQTIDILCNKALIKYGERLPRHVQFVFDEFATIGTIPSIEDTIAVVRSRNIGIDVIIQSIAQLEKNYEKAVAQVILDNCDTLVFLGGKSVSTTEEVSKMIGKETIHQMSYGESRGQSGSSSKNLQVQGRDLIDAAELSKMKRKEMVVLISGINPLKDDKYTANSHPRWNLVKKAGKMNYMEYWKSEKEKKRRQIIKEAKLKYEKNNNTRGAI